MQRYGNFYYHTTNVVIIITVITSFNNCPILHLSYIVMAVELKDFIKATLLDVVSAIKEAQQEAPAGAIVAPVVSKLAHDVPDVYWDSNHGLSIVSFIDFDVAVSATSGSCKSDDKAIGIQVIESVLGFAQKSHTKESDSFENVPRIKFSIPVMYPQKVPQLEHLMKNQ